MGRRPIQKECTYGIEISDWELPYSLSVNSHKEIIEGPLWEHAHLKIDGKFIHPKHLIEKTIEATIIGSRKLTSVLQTPDDYRQCGPGPMGTLMIRGKQKEFYCSIPFDALGALCSLLQFGKVKFLVLSGPKLYHGKTKINSISFQMNFSEEDFM